MSRSIPMPEWEWYGMAAHYCQADWCRYHLTTRVGDYVISTVGEMIRPESWEKEEIGYDRFFETMVFPVRDCTLEECRCDGAPVITDLDGLELVEDLDSWGYVPWWKVLAVVSLVVILDIPGEMGIT